MHPRCTSRVLGRNSHQARRVSDLARQPGRVAREPAEHWACLVEVSQDLGEGVTEPFDTATAMGRMLVQMLGMFDQFERDTITDRVIAGMERKAAAGKWKGGRRPFGYLVNSATSTLGPDPAEPLSYGCVRSRRGGREPDNGQPRKTALPAPNASPEDPLLCRIRQRLPAYVDNP